MRCFLLLSYLVGLLCLCAAEQDPNNKFNYPPFVSANRNYSGNQIFQLGTNVNLQWVTNKTAYSIYLWHQNLAASTAIAGSSLYTKSQNDPESGSLVWTVTAQQFSIVDSPVFFFNLGLSNSIDINSFTSHYFNMTSNPLSSTMSSTTSSTFSTATPSSSATPTTTAQAGTTTSTAASDSPSNAKQIGLGVGLGLGIPILLLLVALAGFSFYHNRKRNRPPVIGPPPHQNGFEIEMRHERQLGEGKRLSDEQRAELLAQHSPTELPGRQRSTWVAELPGPPER